MSALAQQLMQTLDFTEEITVTAELLDRLSDCSEDEPEVPVSGQEMMKTGKYQNKSTMAEAYTTDKKHVKWVRNNVKAETSGQEMRRYRLYVEMRDQMKTKRIVENQDYKKNSQHPIVKKGLTAKSAASPQMIAKKSGGYSSTEMPPEEGRRRGREGSGWINEMSGHEMEWDDEVKEMLANEVDPYVQKQWEAIVECLEWTDTIMLEKMNKVAEIMGIQETVKMFRHVLEPKE